VDNLFIRSRYQPDKSSLNALLQKFAFLDNYRQIFSIPEDCVCFYQASTFSRLLLGLELVIGGDDFRLASYGTGIQLYQIKVATSRDISGNGSPFFAKFSLTAVNGMRIAFTLPDTYL
jgi:hypothetical protein